MTTINLFNYSLKNRKAEGITYRECFGYENPPDTVKLQVKYKEGLKFYLLWDECPDMENIIEGWFATESAAVKYANKKGWQILTHKPGIYDYD